MQDMQFDCVICQAQCSLMTADLYKIYGYDVPVCDDCAEHIATGFINGSEARQRGRQWFLVQSSLERFHVLARRERET